MINAWIGHFVQDENSNPTSIESYVLNNNQNSFIRRTLYFHEVKILPLMATSA